MKIKDAKRIIMDMIGNDTLYDLYAGNGPGIFLKEDGIVYRYSGAAEISKDDVFREFMAWDNPLWIWANDDENFKVQITKKELKLDWKSFLKNNERIRAC